MPTTPITLAVHNFASRATVTDTDLRKGLPIFQDQANSAFMHYWQKHLGPHPYSVGEITLLADDAERPPGAWYAQIFDNAQGAILHGRVQHLADSDFGYHDLLEPKEPKHAPPATGGKAVPPE